MNLKERNKIIEDKGINWEKFINFIKSKGGFDSWSKAIDEYEK